MSRKLSPMKINLNLDSYVNADSLQDFAIELAHHPYLYARQLFGKQVGAVKAVKSLCNYAWNKSTAMNLRLDGKIAIAVKYEDICEKIYNQLPEFAGW